MVSNINFQKQLRRMTSGWKSGPNGHDHGRAGAGSEAVDAVDERSPLISLNNRPAENNRSLAHRILLDRRRTPGMDSDRRSVRWLAHTFNVVKATLLSSPVNILLFFVPLGIVAGNVGWSPTAVFTLNFFAIIPLAAVLSYATEEISIRLGETLGGLLNATFGNAVELIVSIVALNQGQIEVVQSSMLGSILSNLLLVMGMCFFLGGIFNMRDSAGNGTEQSFASATAQTTCSLMTLSSASLIIPTTLYGVLGSSKKKDREESILLLSRGTSIILLILYVMYLVFQLRTHQNLFTDEEAVAHRNAASGIQNGGADAAVAGGDEDDEDDEEHMSPWSAAAVLVVVTVIIAVCAEYLVDSIDAIVETGHISKNFIGLILIPIVGNAAEHVTACVVAVRNKMDLAMGVAIGSSIQIALLVTPFLVILGWLVLDQPMTLHFETFETVAFALSVLVVTYTVQDGKSNYLEGAMLFGLYLIIAIAFYAAPNDALDKASEWLGSS